MILTLAILVTVAVAVYVLVDASYTKAAHAYLDKAEEPPRPAYALPEPTRPAPPMPAARLKDNPHMPRKGDTVIVRGIKSNDIDTHPAIITRAYTGRLINLMLLPDGAPPLPLMNIELFRDKTEADRYLASVFPATPTVAWPHGATDTGSLK